MPRKWFTKAQLANLDIRPFLPGYWEEYTARSDGKRCLQLHVACDFCQTFHLHGGSVEEKTHISFGHRVAHCPSFYMLGASNSDKPVDRPYERTGYEIINVGEFTRQVEQKWIERWRYQNKEASKEGFK